MIQASEDVSTPPRKRREIAIDEASIEFLGRAARSAPLPEDSLTQSPVRDMTTAVQALVAKLRSVNLERLFKTQGILSQLTGADIEAKMRFELDVRQVSEDVKQIQTKCFNAKRLRRDLRQTLEQIHEEDGRQARIIAAARRALAETEDPDPLLKERFVRRLGNLETLRTANAVTISQISLADSNLSSLIDRVEDVTTTLFALWQRDALAVAQSAQPVKKSSPLAEGFRKAHDQLIANLF